MQLVSSPRSIVHLDADAFFASVEQAADSRLRGKPFLRAENPAYPKLIPQEELQIQGVMVALVRNRK